jgi:hypothetical protein
MKSSGERPKPPKPPLTDAEKKKLAYLKKQQELAKGRGKKSPVPGTTTLVKVPGKKYIPRTPVKTTKPGDKLNTRPIVGKPGPFIGGSEKKKALQANLKTNKRK